MIHSFVDPILLSYTQPFYGARMNGTKVARACQAEGSPARVIYTPLCPDW